MFEIQMFKRHIAIHTGFKEECCDVEDIGARPGSHWRLDGAT